MPSSISESEPPPPPRASSRRRSQNQDASSAYRCLVKLIAIIALIVTSLFFGLSTLEIRRNKVVCGARTTNNTQNVSSLVSNSTVQFQQATGTCAGMLFCNIFVALMACITTTTTYLAGYPFISRRENRLSDNSQRAPQCLFRCGFFIPFIASLIFAYHEMTQLNAMNPPLIRNFPLVFCFMINIGMVFLINLVRSRSNQASVSEEETRTIEGWGDEERTDYSAYMYGPGSFRVSVPFLLDDPRETSEAPPVSGSGSSSTTNEHCSEEVSSTSKHSGRKQSLSERRGVKLKLDRIGFQKN